MNRPSKIDYYLDIAETVAERSTCLRRKYGAVLVNHDEIISTGYNGSPRGCPNCDDIGRCFRNELQIASGSNYEVCHSVHAEMNCMLSASRSEMAGGTIYIVGLECTNPDVYASPEPCIICYRLLLNSGVTTCVGRIGRHRSKEERASSGTSITVNAITTEAFTKRVEAMHQSYLKQAIHTNDN